tara:strand:- start:731 stop:934 length:204 start_codon:yes stop_codon:yes gene_type:complete
MEDQEKIIKLAERDVLEMMDILKTANDYLNKIPEAFFDDGHKYPIKLRVNCLYKVLDTELKNNDENA